MTIKWIVDEDFVNYHEPSMFIGTSTCTFKCDKEAGCKVCQNSETAKMPSICVPDTTLIRRYTNNPITKAIVLGGLEPLDQFDEIVSFIYTLRVDYHRKDTVVIYTGYNRNEVQQYIDQLAALENIIVKFGRFIPDCEKHLDDVLGVYLASPNQYAERI